MEWRCFYPRHPRGWRRFCRRCFRCACRVSIHATLAGGDEILSRAYQNINTFLSTPPSRVATTSESFGGYSYTFLSTPPSRVATKNTTKLEMHCLSFYPRHPRGWRQDGNNLTVEDLEFLSTPPSRVATVRWASDIRYEARRFYPRHPRGWRPSSTSLFAFRIVFLSTPPSRVATTRCGYWAHRPICFYPRHPRGWRQDKFSSQYLFQKSFYPRHPRGWRRM